MSRTLGNDQIVLYSYIHWPSHGGVLVTMYSVVRSLFSCCPVGRSFRLGHHVYVEFFANLASNIYDKQLKRLSQATVIQQSS